MFVFLESEFSQQFVAALLSVLDEQPHVVFNPFLAVLNHRPLLPPQSTGQLDLINAVFEVVSEKLESFDVFLQNQRFELACFLL
jgi:hypothetical protein